MMTKKQQKLGIGIGVLVVLLYFALPFLASKGVSFDLTNLAGQPLQGSTCEVYGTITAKCTATSSGYCFNGETANFADGIYSYACICKSDNKRVTGSVQVWSLGVRNYDVTLGNCISGYTPPTTTTSPSCIANGYSTTNGQTCCSCQAGCSGKCFDVLVGEGLVRCSQCTATTTQPSYTNPSSPTTTILPTTCISPYGNVGQVICVNDDKKKCQCTTYCSWVVIGSCGEDTTPTYATTTMPHATTTRPTTPTTTLVYPPQTTTTTIPSPIPSLDWLWTLLGGSMVAVVVVVGVVAIAYLMLKRKR